MLLSHIVSLLRSWSLALSCLESLTADLVVGVTVTYGVSHEFTAEVVVAGVVSGDDGVDVELSIVVTGGVGVDVECHCPCWC